jgi:acetyltransferase-like isoleucine patch superfamily enzyme
VNPLHFIIRIYQGLASRLRNVLYRLLGVRLNGYVWLRHISIPRQWSDITLEEGASLDDGVVCLCSGPAKADKLVIGKGTYVNRHTMFDAHEQVHVGKNCMIGPFCYLTDGNHGTTNAVAVHAQPIQVRPVVLEDDVWLGAGVIILSGVRVGQGAVVGAGAVVTKDVAPNTIVAGVPARPIGLRE